MKKKNGDKELQKVSAELAGMLFSKLYTLGNEIAKKKGYSNHSDIDAVRFYLMQVHHWTPSQVKAMSIEDLAFAIEDIEIE